MHLALDNYSGVVIAKSLLVHLQRTETEAIVQRAYVLDEDFALGNICISELVWSEQSEEWLRWGWEWLEIYFSTVAAHAGRLILELEGRAVGTYHIHVTNAILSVANVGHQ